MAVVFAISPDLTFEEALARVQSANGYFKVPPNLKTVLERLFRSPGMTADEQFAAENSGDGAFDLRDIIDEIVWTLGALDIDGLSPEITKRLPNAPVVMRNDPPQHPATLPLEDLLHYIIHGSLLNLVLGPEGLRKDVTVGLDWKDDACTVSFHLDNLVSSNQDLLSQVASFINAPQTKDWLRSIPGATLEIDDAGPAGTTMVFRIGRLGENGKLFSEAA